jgi:hypothetical protein
VKGLSVRAIRYFGAEQIGGEMRIALGGTSAPVTNDGRFANVCEGIPHIGIGSQYDRRQ